MIVAVVAVRAFGSSIGVDFPRLRSSIKRDQTASGSRLGVRVNANCYFGNDAFERLGGMFLLAHGQSGIALLLGLTGKMLLPCGLIDRQDAFDLTRGLVLAVGSSAPLIATTHGFTIITTDGLRGPIFLAVSKIFVLFAALVLAIQTGFIA